MTDETRQELAQALRETELVAAQLVPEFRSSSAWIQQTHEEISCDPELNFEDGAVHTLVALQRLAVNASSLALVTARAVLER